MREVLRIENPNYNRAAKCHTNIGQTRKIVSESATTRDPVVRSKFCDPAGQSFEIWPTDCKPTIGEKRLREGNHRG